MPPNKNTPPLEHTEQCTFVQWFKMQYPHVLIYAIPNGGKRGIREAVKLKREGVKAGIPDLHIPQWRLWVEMKRQEGGRVSKDQKEVIEHLEKIGHTVIIAEGGLEAIKKVMFFVNNA